MLTKYSVISIFFATLLVLPIKADNKAQPAKVKPKIIVWDLGGVLFRSSRMSLAFEIGLGSLIHYTITHLPSPAFTDLLFKVLNHVEPMPKNIPIIHDENGKELPYCMYKWITGEQTGPFINKQIQDFIEADNQPGFFTGNTQKKICTRLSNTLFTPQTFAHGVKPIKAGRDLLRACVAHGTTRMMILSNWDRLSFDLLRNNRTGKVILQHFKADDCMISGSIGYAKPDLHCFEHFLRTYNLAAHECIFIDDQLENVKAAEKCGMHAIHLDKGNYHTVADTLRSLNVL
ncbi:HAD-IA family hydrolase [Candidatus Dependentiae bacterium]|nr:HAD-IA family hydrolase [Candidatus Dependentiae bacterium]